MAIRTNTTGKCHLCNEYIRIHSADPYLCATCFNAFHRPVYKPTTPTYTQAIRGTKSAEDSTIVVKIPCNYCGDLCLEYRIWRTFLRHYPCVCFTCLGNIKTMAKPMELIISDGDTQGWAKLDFESFSQEGKGFLAVLKLTIKDKTFDFKRKCWFIPEDMVRPITAGATRLGYRVVDNRTTAEAFDSFFTEEAKTGVTPPKPVTKAELLAKFNLICTQQAMLSVTVTNSMTISDLKPIYRKAALVLHPDRNNGDGSRMSELNMIWKELQIYD